MCYVGQLNSLKSVGLWGHNKLTRHILLWTKFVPLWFFGAAVCLCVCVCHYYVTVMCHYVTIMCHYNNYGSTIMLQGRSYIQAIEELKSYDKVKEIY